MLFNSIGFLLLFLPAVALVTLGLLRGQPRIVFLVIASLLFYGASSTEHATVLLLCLLWVYAWIDMRATPASRWSVFMAATLPMLALVYYKYLGFLLGSFGDIPPIMQPLLDRLHDKALPAGISFFAFELVSFAIDRYRGEAKRSSGLMPFALFVTFFPHLIAGPIIRYNQIVEGLRQLPTWRLTAPVAKEAFTYLIMGLSLKVLLADQLADCIAPYLHPHGSIGIATSIYVILAYSFQIYLDFYGYSLMAIGLGLFFGFRFPANFDRPYSALNPRDFWRRWHITLSYWIRDYIYLPLGGNRAYIRNILVVFAVCGLWHGAGWNYVVWGIYHGLLVVGYHLNAKHWDNLPPPLQLGATFILVSLGWTLFLFDFHAWKVFFSAAIAPGLTTISDPDHAAWALLLAAASATYGLRIERYAAASMRNMKQALSWGLLTAALLFGNLLFLNKPAAFIYFRF